MLDIYIVLEYNIHKVNILDKNRQKFTFFSLASLILGVFIYLILRNDTYFHAYISEDIKSFFYIQTDKNFFIDFLKYYFIDFLWGLSLVSALNAVSLLNNKKSILINSIFTIFSGLLFELLQLSGIVNGTFDFIDILMYAVAASIVAVININKFKEY